MCSVYQFTHYLGDKSAQKIDNELAMYIREHLQLGYSHYQSLRLLLKEYIVFPTADKMTSMAASIMPELTLQGEGDGIKCSLEEALKVSILYILYSIFMGYWISAPL